MIKNIIGDALENDCDILCHQVNLDGVMGGGIALQIARRFPTVEKEYREYPNKMLGEVCFSKADKYVVANCFSQNPFFETNYIALKQCMEKVKDYMNKNGLTTVAIPYHYGCGIAFGNWDKVLSIVQEVFSDKLVKIYRLI